MRITRMLIVALAFLVAGPVLPLQAQQSSPVITPIPSASPEDVNSIDAIIGALYDVISGPKGQARDWRRMRSLFVPEARLIPAVQRKDAPGGLRLMTVNDYIASSGGLLVEVGFTEREIARRVEEFGAVAHVFSTYEGFREGESGPAVRGINSIQLFYDGTRWWVVSVFWDAEREGLRIPETYLRSSGHQT